MIENYFDRFKKACDALIELKVNIEADGWRKKVVSEQEAGCKGRYCGYIKDGETKIRQCKIYPIFDRIPDIERFSAEVEALHVETLQQEQFDENCADYLHGLYLKLNTLANGLRRLEESIDSPNIENTVKMFIEPAIRLLSDDAMFSFRNKIEQRVMRESTKETTDGLLKLTKETAQQIVAGILVKPHEGAWSARDVELELKQQGYQYSHVSISSLEIFRAYSVRHGYSARKRKDSS